MSNIVKMADFNGHKIPVISHNNEHWMAAEAIGSALGYDIPRKAIHEIYRRHQSELNEYSCVLSLRAVGDSQRRDSRLYNEEGVMVITMLSRQPKAAEFRRWAVKVLKSYRKGEMVPAGNADHLGLAAEIGKLRDENAGLKMELLDLMRFKVAALESSNKPKRVRWQPEERAELLRLRALGMSQLEISKKMRRPEGSISSLLRAMRIGGAL